MKVVLILFLFALVWCEDLITQEGADRIRAAGATWEIEDPDQSIFKGISVEDFASTLESSWPLETTLPELEFAQNETFNGSDGDSRLLQMGMGMNMGYRLPREFDGRKEWGKCIHSGGNQKKCNGCWAFGVANHLSDRFCIKGWDVELSPQDLLECTPGNKCCKGGSAENAYKYVMKTGIVDQGCKPFDSKCNECRPRSCTRYRCVPNSAWVTQDTMKAKREIYENGPITAIFDVYDDFAYYKGGVYYKTSTKKIGIHSAVLVGWGVDKRRNEYWICKNSWGDHWGDHGFFKIKVGDSGINSYITSCKPLIDS